MTTEELVAKVGVLEAAKNEASAKLSASKEQFSLAQAEFTKAVSDWTAAKKELLESLGGNVRFPARNISAVLRQTSARLFVAARATIQPSR